MKGNNDELVMNHEVVNAVSNDMVQFANALNTMRIYAREDDGLTPDKFGVIAGKTGVGANYTTMWDVLQASLDKAAPLVDAMGKALFDSAKWTTETEAENAMGIARADGDR